MIKQLLNFFRSLISRLHYADATDTAQRGSIIIPMVGVIFVGLVLLGSVHLGYLFYMKRELQNAADNGAQAGALELAINGCTTAKEVAKTHVTQSVGDVGATIECGYWDELAESAEQAFKTPVSNPNAVRVKLNQEYNSTVPFMSAQTLSVEAVAAHDGGGVATFSVGPQLLSLNADQNGLLPLLLKGIGLDPNITVLNHNGLANVKLTPAGLLKELGIEVPADITLGSLHQLLDADLGVGIPFINILEASIKLIENQGVKQPINQEVLNALRDSLNKMPSEATLVNLFGSNSNIYPNLFSLAKPEKSPAFNNYNQSAGLNANLNLESILGVGLAIASGSEALGLSVDLSNSILSSLIQASIKVGIIEPPTIAIGGVGTTAHSANIRIFIHLCLGLGTCNKPDSSSRLLGLKLDLPIVLEVMNATATLQQVCTPTSNSSLADIAVKSEVAGVCIGNFGFSPGTGQTNPFSYQQSCTDLITQNPSQLRKQILDVNVLNLLKLEINDALAVPALASQTPLPVASFTSPRLPQTITVDTNPLSNLGSTAEHLTDVILYQLLGGLLTNPSLNNGLSSSNSKALTADMVQQYWSKAVGQENCDTKPKNKNGSNCRKKVLNQTLSLIEQDINILNNSLDSFKNNNLLGALGGTLGSLLSLDLLGVVGGLLDTVGQLLNAILDGILGLPTTKLSQCVGSSGLLGFTNYGSEEGCFDFLESSIQEQNSNGGPPLYVLGLVKSLLDLLKIWDILDLLGKVVENLLQGITGIKLGTVDTTLYHIDCKPNVRLVY